MAVYHERHTRVMKFLYDQRLCRMDNNVRTCVTAVDHITFKLDTIERELREVTEMTSFSTRIQRGLINRVGSIGKILFGTMDSQDEEEINNHLKIIDRKMHKTEMAMKKQIQIVSRNLEILNDTLTKVNENEERLLQLEKDLMKKETNLEVLYNLSIIVEELLIETDSLLDFVTQANHGIINPKIIPHSQIMRYLREAQPYIPAGTQLPISLTNTNIHLLSKLLKPTIFSKTNKLIIVLCISLITPQEFDLLQVYPIPIPVSNSTSLYSIVDIRNEFLAIDITTERYTEYSAEDLKKCSQVGDQYFCPTYKPSNKMKSENPCEITLYLKNKASETCEHKLIHLVQPMLISLKDRASWLYTVPRIEELTVTCKNKDKYTLEITGSGTLTIRNNCIITAADFILETVLSVSKYFLNSWVRIRMIEKDN
ncbi:uncharacterized protein [Prorops nasuta]|uniref:uncharacterized protein n=1 Tax=Prorops nasuta TaxID=863751 RepID=UPI0034CE5E92